MTANDAKKKEFIRYLAAYIDEEVTRREIKRGYYDIVADAVEAFEGGAGETGYPQTIFVVGV